MLGFLPALDIQFVVNQVSISECALFWVPVFVFSLHYCTVRPVQQHCHPSR